MKSKKTSSAAPARPIPAETPANTAARQAPSQQLPKTLAIYLPWAIVLAAILFVAAIRIRLLQIPLERDEGEYAYAGQLMLHGIPPYRDACNMKLPGVYAAYALMMGVFGQTIGGIHLGFLLANAATILLVFLLGKRLFGPSAGVAAAAAYALMSLSPGVYGTQAHATHFVVLPVVAACLLLLRAVDTRRLAPLFTSGLLFGLAIVMKQHGLFFAIFGAVYLLLARRESGMPLFSIQALRKQATLGTGVVVPLVFTAMVLWAAGVFEKFWFWTFTYAREYVLENQLSAGFDNFTFSFFRVVGPNLLIWIFAAGGLLLIWWKKEDRAAAAFLTSLLVFSFLAICPGLYFREHYFVMVLPAVALLAGAGFGSLQRFIGNALPIFLYGVALLFPLIQQSDFFFRMSPREAGRSMYSVNPFPEAIPIADYIRTHSAESARIAVLGSEPEIYFYARRRSATGYIYTYGLMEPQPYALKMQNDMIHEIETARPEYVVLTTLDADWDIRPGSSRHIFEWWYAYRDQHYKKVGFAEVLSAEHTEYRWDNLESYDPKSDIVLVVYQRKD